MGKIIVGTNGTKYKKAPTPDEIIDEAIKRKDWFSAFSNAVTYFEHWGYWRLEWYCIKENIGFRDRLKHLNVSTLIHILFLLKIIDEDTFSKIIVTIRERNRLIHPASRNSGISYRYRKDRDKATQILDDAKQCIQRIKAGVGKD